MFRTKLFVNGTRITAMLKKDFTKFIFCALLGSTLCSANINLGKQNLIFWNLWIDKSSNHFLPPGGTKTVPFNSILYGHVISVNAFMPNKNNAWNILVSYTSLLYCLENLLFYFKNRTLQSCTTYSNFIQTKSRTYLF